MGWIVGFFLLIEKFHSAIIMNFATGNWCFNFLFSEAKDIWKLIFEQIFVNLPGFRHQSINEYLKYVKKTRAWKLCVNRLHNMRLKTGIVNITCWIKCLLWTLTSLRYKILLTALIMHHSLSTFYVLFHWEILTIES